ncbi:MAG TPA: CrcB family protein [Burkholderiaceae bacterium]
MLSVIAICLGASTGALLRWLLGLWLNPHGILPWGTHPGGQLDRRLPGRRGGGAVQALPQLDPVWRLALVAGFLDGLTTFSSFSAEMVCMLAQQRYALALGTALLHVAGSLLLTIAGMRCATLVLTYAGK